MADNRPMALLDLADIPVGVGRNKWPISTVPIEVGSADALSIRLDHPRSSKELPSIVRMSVAVKGSLLWSDVRISPADCLAKVARAWMTLAFEDQSFGVKLSEWIAASSYGPRVQEILVRRVGLDVVVTLGYDKRFVIPLMDSIEALEELGHALAVRLPTSCPSVETWRSRYPRDSGSLMKYDALLIRRTVDELSELSLAPIGEPEDLMFPDDLRMAARLAGDEIRTSSLKKAFDVIRSHGRVQSEYLECLSEQAVGFRDAFMSYVRPWQCGHELAGWLRNLLEIGEDQCVDIDGILSSLSVSVEDVDLDSPAIDAIAAWGSHGPVIVLNASGLRSRKSAGRRATLAHELCHLLVDRAGALPVAEAQGRRVRVRKPVESRANAFAAEFLLPREIAARRLRQVGDLDAAVGLLEREYCVSRTLVLRQLDNHPADAAGPSEIQRRQIKSYILASERGVPCGAF